MAAGFIVDARLGSVIRLGRLHFYSAILREINVKGAEARFAKTARGTFAVRS